MSKLLGTNKPPQKAQFKIHTGYNKEFDALVVQLTVNDKPDSEMAFPVGMAPFIVQAIMEQIEKIRKGEELIIKPPKKRFIN